MCLTSGVAQWLADSVCLVRDAAESPGDQVEGAFVSRTIFTYY
jgi:hypothetical protein